MIIQLRFFFSNNVLFQSHLFLNKKNDLNCFCSLSTQFISCFVLIQIYVLISLHKNIIRYIHDCEAQFLYNELSSNS